MNRQQRDSNRRNARLQGLIDGVDDQEGFWTCPKLYGPDGRRIAA